MRKVLLLVLTLLLAGAAAEAQLPPVGYIGLYTDELHNEWCAIGAGMYEVQMWMWCLPSIHGMICAEFKINYPVNVIQSIITWHTTWVIDPPTPSEGASVCLADCQWDWYWMFYQQLWVIDSTPTYIEIVKHPDPGVADVQFANCEPGYPIEPAIVHTNLYINYDPASPECSGTAVESTSWGAIKSLTAR